MNEDQIKELIKTHRRKNMPEFLDSSDYPEDNISTSPKSARSGIFGTVKKRKPKGEKKLASSMYLDDYESSEEKIPLDEKIDTIANIRVKKQLKRFRGKNMGDSSYSNRRASVEPLILFNKIEELEVEVEVEEPDENRKKAPKRNKSNPSSMKRPTSGSTRKRKNSKKLNRTRSAGSNYNRLSSPLGKDRSRPRGRLNNSSKGSEPIEILSINIEEEDEKLKTGFHNRYREGVLQVPDIRMIPDHPPAFEKNLKKQLQEATNFRSSIAEISELSEKTCLNGIKYAEYMKELAYEIELSKKYYKEQGLSNAVDFYAKLVNYYANIQNNMVNHLARFSAALNSHVEETEEDMETTTENWNIKTAEEQKMLMKYCKTPTVKRGLELEHDLTNARQELFDSSYNLTRKLYKYETQHKFEYLNSLSGLTRNCMTSHNHPEFVESSSEYFNILNVNIQKGLNSSIQQMRRCDVLKEEVEYQKSLEPETEGKVIEGWLMYQLWEGKKKKTGWELGYFSISYGYLILFKDQGKSKMRWNLMVSTVKPRNDVDRNDVFEVTVLEVSTKIHKTILLQGESIRMKQRWMSTITNAAMESLSSQKITNNKGKSIKMPLDVQENLSREINPSCVDCGKPNPDWASINLGVMMCLDCSGVHRSLGVNYSKIRALGLDEWDPNVIELMLTLKNDYTNEILEKNLDPNDKIEPDTCRDERNQFIQSKYVDKIWAENNKMRIGELEQRLLMACNIGDLRVVLECLLNDVDIGWVDSSGNTALTQVEQFGVCDTHIVGNI
eukprot:TRINITY_DN8472_c0_g1_i1.p1 TRINITY_DN8472_c0_g1~~TRINITY_DN8472_c0_g1_i1.p1  ORF type:complete len:828 (-),score=174.38 TRINITY_DN8472_c0_g1_i1:325-2670(-)